MTPAELRRLDRAAFLRAFGGVYERSPWVAGAAWAAGPFDSVEALGAAMADAVRAAGPAAGLALIRAHPDLAGKAGLAGDLTEESRGEQAGAGLDRLSPDEHARFHALNDAYRARFGFPFVVAVRGLGKEAILRAFEERLGNARDAEVERALTEIDAIALHRLRLLVDG